MLRSYNKNKLNLIMGFSGVFLLFTSDLYGLEEDSVLTIRAIGITLGFASILLGWLMFIVDFWKKKKS